MTQKKRLNGNLLTISMLIATCLTFLLASFAAFAEKNERIQGEILRLHILPNSDSEEDLRLKYELRDFILEGAEDYFSGVTTLEEAAEKLNLAEIQKNAEAFVAAQGYTYKVHAELANIFFTTRVYGNITMPAGNYTALRLIIGEGEGQNWWCVVFPPLCLPAVTGASTGEPYFSPEISETIETGGRIEVRFKIYEWWQGVFG